MVKVMPSSQHAFEIEDPLNLDMRFFNSESQKSSHQLNTYLMHLFTAMTIFLKKKLKAFINVVSDNRDEMGRNCIYLFGRKFVQDARGRGGKMKTKQVVKTRQYSTTARD